jgi:hypothetical protein
MCVGGMLEVLTQQDAGLQSLCVCPPLKRQHVSNAAGPPAQGGMGMG